MSDIAKTKNRKDTKQVIENALLAAIDLRDSIFEIGDEPLIRTMDLLIYALGTVATRSRLESAHEVHGGMPIKRQASAA